MKQGMSRQKALQLAVRALELRMRSYAFNAQLFAHGVKDIATEKDYKKHAEVLEAIQVLKVIIEEYDNQR